MKKGGQMMVMFGVTIFSMIFFANAGIDLLIAVGGLLLPVIWFYQMFDTMHTLTLLRKRELDMPDDDDFLLPDNLKLRLPKNRTVAKVIATILILSGGFALLQAILRSLSRFGVRHDIIWAIESAVFGNLIPTLIAVALIIAGIMLMKGKKVKKGEDKNG